MYPIPNELPFLKWLCFLRLDRSITRSSSPPINSHYRNFVPFRVPPRPLSAKPNQKRLSDLTELRQLYSNRWSYRPSTCEKMEMIDRALMSYIHHYHSKSAPTGFELPSGNSSLYLSIIRIEFSASPCLVFLSSNKEFKKTRYCVDLLGYVGAIFMASAPMCFWLAGANMPVWMELDTSGTKEKCQIPTWSARLILSLWPMSKGSWSLVFNLLNWNLSSAQFGKTQVV